MEQQPKGLGFQLQEPERVRGAGLGRGQQGDLPRAKSGQGD